MCRTAWIALGLLAIVSSCSGGDRDDIDRMMDRRARAMNEKNLPLYMSCISLRYREGGADYATLRAEMAKYFSSVPGVEVRVSGRRVYLENSTATVIQDVQVRAVTGNGAAAASGQEKVLVRREWAGWKITGGIHGP